MIQRKGIIIYFDDKKVLDELDKTIVHIYYVSEKNKYAVIYCEANRYKPLCQSLEANPNIISFEDSLLEVENNSF